MTSNARALLSHMTHESVCLYSKMACQSETGINEPLQAELDFPAHPAQPHVQLEYDFIEQPPQDFFCPVTLELLIEPHQTTCCGNHLSQEAAERLKNGGKPCPMCKEPQLATISDKYMKRKVNNVRVCCSFKGSGCEWEGEVSNLRSHVDSCPKRPWHCEHCDYESTHEIGTSEHVPTCTKYPIVCPNSCEVGSVPRSEVEEHLMVCPLQIVDCQYAEVGCDVKVPRRDMACHLEEAQQQHLLSATLLNVRMTQENLAEKDRIIAEKDVQLKEKDHYIADLQLQLMELEKKVTALQQGVEKLDIKLVNSISALHSYYTSQGYTYHTDLTVKEFEKTCRAGKGSWVFEFLCSGGYQFRFCVLSMKGEDRNGTHIIVSCYLFCGDNDVKQAWPVELNIQILVLNQLGDHDHHVTSICKIKDKEDKEYEPENICIQSGKNTQYLKNDCLKFQVYVKCKRNARYIKF